MYLVVAVQHNFGAYLVGQYLHIELHVWPAEKPEARLYYHMEAIQFKPHFQLTLQSR
jgi:hypothetical protein